MAPSRPSPTVLPRLGPPILFVALALLYATTACRTVGPGDSAELAVALGTWGIPHAPGYPLLSLLGNLATHLLGWIEPAWVLNVMNSGFAALACAVLAAAVTSATGSAVAGFVAGALLGTSRVFWHYALAIEVFSLNALFASLLLLFLCRWLSRDPRGARGALPACVLVMTTMLTHQPTLALLSIPVLVVILFVSVNATRFGVAAPTRSVLVSCVAAAAVGLLPIAYIPIVARGCPPVNWGDVRDLAGLARLFLRADFGTSVLVSPGIAVNAVLEHGPSVSPLGLRPLLAAIADVPRSLGWAAPVLVALGIVWAARRSMPVLVLGVLFLALAAVFFGRVNAPMLPVYLGVMERFFILPHVVLAFLAGCGWALVIEWTRARHLPDALPLAAGLALTAAPLLVTHARAVDMRGNRFTHDFGRNLVSGMPEHAVFFSSGDLFTNGFLYQQACLHERPDLALLSQDLAPLPWYVRQVRRCGRVRVPRTSSDPPWPIADWLGASLAPDDGAAGRPCVAVKLADDSYRERYRVQPMGVWSVVFPRQQPIDLVPWERSCAQVVDSWLLPTLVTEYPAESWEASESVFYTYALGQLQGLRDVMEVVLRPAPSFEPVAALDIPARWPTRRRSEFLGYRADFIRSCLEDGWFASMPQVAPVVAAKAMAVAASATALDSTNTMSLQTAAWLRANEPDLADSLAELDLRERIVAIRAGDFDELVPYFRLALAVSRRYVDRRDAILGRAETAQRRLVETLAICDRLHHDPDIAKLRMHWSAPLAEIAELR